MLYKALCITLVFLLAACDSAPRPQVGAEPGDMSTATVRPAGETEPTLADGANDAALLIDVRGPANSLILGTGMAAGLEIYRLDGERVGVMSERPVSLVDVSYGFPLAGESIALIVAFDPAAAELVAYRLAADGTSLAQISQGNIAVEAEFEGLCLYHSPLSGKFYALGAGQGMMQQWELFDDGGNVAARRIREMPLGLGAAHCAVSNRDGMIYYAQETVGVWQLPAEPETEAEAVPVAFAEPHGPFVGDIKGVAMYEFESGGGLLLISDADANRLQLYDLDTFEHRGAVVIDTVQATEGIAVATMPLGEGFDAGMVIVADDENDGKNTNYKLVSWDEIAGVAGVTGNAGINPTSKRAPSAITVTANAETEPVLSYGDAADDPAIWVHPDDPAKSVVIGSQKQRGVNVYDLHGRLLQSLADGRINNVDVRYGFSLGGVSVDIVTGSNRSKDSIEIYRVDPANGLLENITDGVVPTGMADPYGLCMYKSRVTGDFYTVVNDTDGVVRQFRLVDRGNGRVGGEPVREFSVGSQTEGCVADDATGDLYIGEEGFGIWKYAAEPDRGNTRTLVDSIEDGDLVGDVEGMSLYLGPEDEGYLIVSNQGANNFGVYARAGNNRFLGHFHVVADAQSGIDGISETDGLDVTSADLGPAFPNGIFVAQDGRNITPDERQNFKIVDWRAIAAAMDLESFDGYDPRSTD